MAGAWNANALPRLPGAYFNFVAQRAVAIPPAVGDVVALPFTHSWGPLEEAVLCNSYSEAVAVYGLDLASPGYRAFRQAFVGEATRGRRGAGAVLAYRMGGASAAKATRTLQNTTPADALRVDAVYEGTRGNNLRLTLRTNSNDNTKKDFVLLDGATEIEVFTYDPAVATPLAKLATAVNGVSNWARLTVLLDTLPLAAVTGVALTGGDSGATLLAGDWTAMFTAMEPERFGYFAPFDLTDSSILASLKTWAQNANAKGRRFFVVTGGALDEFASDAVARAATFNDPDFVTIGVGSIRDLNLLDANGDPVVLSTAQFVPRLAGIMSALGENRSLSGARVGGVKVLNGANEAGIDATYDGGVIVLATDSDPDAPVHVMKGLTTYTTKTDADRPYSIFRTPKYVRTMHDLQIETSEWFASNVKGQLPVNSATRSAVLADLSTRMQLRQDNNSIQAGWSVAISADPPPSDDDEFVAIDWALAFGRSLEQLLGTIQIR